MSSCIYNSSMKICGAGYRKRGHTLWPCESFSGPRSEPMDTSAPEMTPVSYPTTIHQFKKSRNIRHEQKIAPKSKPLMHAQPTSIQTNHVVRSSPSATTASSGISPASYILWTSSFWATRFSSSAMKESRQLSWRRMWGAASFLLAKKTRVRPARSSVTCRVGTYQQ